MRRRRTRISILLMRWGWTRNPDSWRIQCRNELGKRTYVLVELGDDGVVLRPAQPGPLNIGLLNVGRLRIALREAVTTYSKVRGLDAPEEVDDLGQHAA
ncbi:hypothetical protein [Actinokineospora sp. NPDC004072]